ncbi:hypothetical protein PR202_ga02334 [Eleusine coracana subsp. coracana]|uniref:Pectinesterase inhibitor domain-containing protein n=1 Tax=Eleusine coracana subsp. coracana TaxID=191504 RepID=A0AAV5BKI7_ELECO|nr:hypothetical protein PR202_ga02334 [Eleusine coracana subsp. coracana]
MMQTVVILLLAIPVAPVLAIGSPAINATCAALTPSPGDYCLGFLSGDPAAMAATDARGVAAAAMNMTARKAASTSRVIADLVDELTICRGYYTTMVESLSGVLVDFRAGRFDNAALEKANKAGDQPMDCDKLLLQGNAHKNPFSKENGENDKLARLAVAITSLLARKRIVVG